MVVQPKICDGAFVYTISDKKVLNDSIKLMVLEVPHVAKKAAPGQFVIVRIDEKGERIPLTIADFDQEKGTVTIIFQEIGKSTIHLGTLNAGDNLATVAGPLGHPTEIASYGTIVCIGGGVGIAPVFPIARALKEAGNRVISIVGARTKSLLFWEDMMRSVSDTLIVCTDDGSHGVKGVVTDPLKEIIATEKVDRVWAIGPAIMMKFVSEATRPLGVPTLVSLNTIMIDGTGMCGGCRVVYDQDERFVCVDGPEFDGHKVDWDNLLARQKSYISAEKRAMKQWQHKCNIGLTS